MHSVPCRQGTDCGRPGGTRTMLELPRDARSALSKLGDVSHVPQGHRRRAFRRRTDDVHDLSRPPRKTRARRDRVLLLSPKQGHTESLPHERGRSLRVMSPASRVLAGPSDTLRELPFTGNGTREEPHELRQLPRRCSSGRERTKRVHELPPCRDRNRTSWTFRLRAVPRAPFRIAQARSRSVHHVSYGSLCRPTRRNPRRMQLLSPSARAEWAARSPALHELPPGSAKERDARGLRARWLFELSHIARASRRQPADLSQVPPGQDGSRTGRQEVRRLSHLQGFLKRCRPARNGRAAPQSVRLPGTLADERTLLSGERPRDPEEDVIEFAAQRRARKPVHCRRIDDFDARADTHRTFHCRPGVPAG